MDGKMTIKQLADALGVSKTFVRKHMSEEFRCNYTETTANGVITITPEGCKLLSETIGNRKETTENQDAETTANSESITLPKVVWEALQDQLKAKDLQIAEITKALEREQHLQAGTLQRALPGAAPEASDEPLEAFQGEEEPMVGSGASEGQSGLQEAVKGLSFREKWKLLFGKS